MKAKIKLILDNDLPKGEYEFQFSSNTSKPPVVIPPNQPDPPPNNNEEPPFPQVKNMNLLRKAESINQNTLLPFDFNGTMYFVSYNSNIKKNMLFMLYDSGATEQILNLDIIMNGKEVRGLAQDITEIGNDLYGLVDIADRLYLMKYKQGSNFKHWYVLGEIHLNGATDTHHDLFVDHENNVMLSGRLRGARDWKEKHPILLDRRGIPITIAGKPEDLMNPGNTFFKLDPLSFQPNYLTDKIRRGFYGSRSISLNRNMYTFINTYFQNEDYKPLSRPDRHNVGTGPIYPTIIRNYGEVVAWDKHLINQTPFLTNWKSKESIPFNPQIGQIYIGSVLDRGSHLQAFVIVRKDPHYIERDDQDRTELWTGQIDKQQLIQWFDWKAKQ